MDKGFYHIVHFWLARGIGESDRTRFIAAVHDLAQSENVRSIRVAAPAGTDRPVVDNTWDVQLLTVFADKAAHDRYQLPSDSVHQHFVDNFKKYWTRVVIYDSVEI